MQSFKIKFSGVTILQGVECPIFLLISAWALQHCSANALPVILCRGVLLFSLALSLWCFAYYNLCNLRILTERARAHKQPLFLCFFDFEKAFDTVSHKKLWSQTRLFTLYGAAKDAGMRINVRKTEVMKVCENAPPMSITVNGDNISDVSSVKYLGPRLNAEALCEATRLALARERMGKLDPQWRSRASESAAHSVPGMAHTHIRR